MFPCSLNTVAVIVPKADSKNPSRLARSHVPFDKLDQHLLTPQLRVLDVGFMALEISTSLVSRVASREV